MSRNIFKRSNRTGTTSSDILRDPINTLAQLRAYPVTDTLDKTLVYVKGESSVFAYHYDSTDTDDNSEIIEPDSGSGRWIKVIGGDSYSDEDAQDAIFDFLVAGTNITLTHDDAANSLTIDATDTNTNQLTEWTVSDGANSTSVAHNQTVQFNGTGGISVSESSRTVTIDGSSISGDTYSLTTAQDGSNVDITLDAASGTDSTIQLTAGSNITLTSNSASEVTIAATDTTGIALTDLSVGTDAAASGSGAIAYDDTTGVFTYTPPDLSSYVTEDTNTFRTVQADGSSIGATETLNLIGGTNVTLSESGGAITISSTDTDTNTFRTVQVDGSAIGATETLNLIGGTNVTLSESGGSVTITAASGGGGDITSVEMTGDTGSYSGTTGAVTLDFVGGNGIDTSVSSNNCSINLTGAQIDDVDLTGSDYSADINQMDHTYLCYKSSGDFSDFLITKADALTPGARVKVVNLDGSSSFTIRTKHTNSSAISKLVRVTSAGTQTAASSYTLGTGKTADMVVTADGNLMFPA